MADVVTRTTRQGYGGRLKNALGGIIVGLVMFAGAFPLLWFNEGRTVKERKSLEEGAAAVVHVHEMELDAGNEGKLVHVAGRVDVEGTLSDEQFGVSVEALALKRRVEMYQWREKRESREEKKLGGGTETVTTYRYDKAWDDEVIDSRRFEEPGGHQNPGEFPVQAAEHVASRARLGAYTLDEPMLRRMDAWQGLRVDAAAASSLEGFRRVDDGFYRGANPQAPQVGDVRVRFDYVPESEFSIVAKQVGSGFAAYQTKAGNTILMVDAGRHSAEEMFAGAQRANTILSWVLRGLGFALMWIGLSMVLRPLSVLFDVIPLLGSLVAKGTGFVAFVFALLFSLVTIALAWLWVRPVVGVTLLAAAVACVFLLRRKKAAPAFQSAPGGPPPPSMPPPPPR